MSRWAVWVLPLVVLALMLMARVGDNVIAPRIANALFDHYQQLIPRPYQDPRAHSGFSVRYVDIDEESLAHYGAWPWPRALLARMIERLKDGGAAAVVMTMKLSGPDVSPGERLLAGLPRGSESEQLKEELANLPDANQSLADALLSTRAITGFELVPQASTRAPVLKSTVALVGPGEVRGAIPVFAGAESAPAKIESSSSGEGAINLLPDADGGVRRLPLVFMLNKTLLPSLDAEVLRLANKQSNIVVQALQPGDGFLSAPTGVAGVASGSAAVPTSPDGRMWIRFGPPNAQRRISAWKLIEDQIPASELANAIVYVGDGAAAPVLTALGDQRPEAAVRAEAMEQILLGQFLRRPAWAEQSELAFMVVISAALIFLLTRYGAVLAGMGLIAASGGAIYFSWHMFEYQNLLFDSAYPVISVALVFVAGLATQWGTLGYERNRLHRTFDQLLPANALSLVSQHPGVLKLKGETREMSYLVCRVRNFSKLAESYVDDPQGFSRLMKRVMTPLTDAVLAQRGAVDRLAPGMLSALFNAPLDDPDHAVHVCECALRMIEALDKVNRGLEQERRADGATVGPIGIGIGVNTGPGVVADFGTASRPEYTAAGRAASLTPDIEALSDRYGPAIVVGEATRKACERNFAFLEVDMLASGAGAEPTKLYALLGNPLVRASPKFRALQTFHDHIFQSYRAQEWTKTRALIEQCRTLSGASQQLYDLYLARIAYFEANPPGPEWEGSFRPVLA